MSSNHYQFPPSLISAEILNQLPTGFVIRPLHLEDYDKGIYAPIPRPGPCINKRGQFHNNLKDILKPFQN